MATKSIAKSIRLSDEVYDYIMNAPGKGFNEKFENIILQAKKEESDRKERLAGLQKSIDEQQRKLYQLFDKYRYLDDFFRQIIHMRHQVDALHKQLDKAMTESDNPQIDSVEKENEYEQI